MRFRRKHLIPAGLNVLSPNGGETLTVGATETITWVAHSTIRSVSKVKLFHTKDGTTWIPIKILDTNPGTYDWTVPPVPGGHKKCKVKITLLDSRGNPVGSDESDSTFIIQP